MSREVLVVATGEGSEEAMKARRMVRMSSRGDLGPRSWHGVRIIFCTCKVDMNE